MVRKCCSTRKPLWHSCGLSLKSWPMAETTVLGWEGGKANFLRSRSPKESKLEGVHVGYFSPRKEKIHVGREGMKSSDLTTVQAASRLALQSSLSFRRRN